MDFNLLGKRIREERRARSLSQFQLAVLAGVTPNTIGNLERGRTPGTSLEVVVRVLEALGMKLSDFEEVA